MKILTVANHIAILEELEKELSAVSPGSEIIRETDALMAGKYAFNHEVDIVFAEADMKRMNGLQLIQFVRHKHPDVKSFLIGTEEDLSGFLGVWGCFGVCARGFECGGWALLGLLGPF